jgi:hypothetical protein
LPPPEHPLESSGSEGWVQVETRLGTALPSDYREFIPLYGTGYINTVLFVLNPFSDRRTFDLIRIAGETLRTLRNIRAEWSVQFPDMVPYGLYPEPGGILPWGEDTKGVTLFWLTKGGPDEWITVLGHIRNDDWEEHPLSMSDFLLNLCQGKLESKMIRELPDGPPKFRPGYLPRMI